MITLQNVLSEYDWHNSRSLATPINRSCKIFSELKSAPFAATHTDCGIGHKECTEASWLTLFCRSTFCGDCGFPLLDALRESRLN